MYLLHGWSLKLIVFFGRNESRIEPDEEVGDDGVHSVSEEEAQMSHEVWNTLLSFPFSPYLPPFPFLISILP